jgi:hypothetical protein
MQALACEHPPAKQALHAPARKPPLQSFFSLQRRDQKKSPAASQFCDHDGKRAVSGAAARASRA